MKKGNVTSFRTAISGLLLLLAPAVAFAGAVQPNMLATLRPQGWIGTTNAWAQGLGIAFALLDLVLLVLAWRSLQKTGTTHALTQMLLVALVVLPLAVVFFGYTYGLEASKSVEACGSCHVMDTHVSDLRNPGSESLAALHFKNRYIQENHCYSCHTDYGMSGTVRAKLEGLGHVIRNTTKSYTLPLAIAHPYPNWRCLNCHGESQKFRNTETHSAEELLKLYAGEESCLECHGPAHSVSEKETEK